MTHDDLPHQDRISVRGVAIQCRVTTENVERDFAPDTGTRSVSSRHPRPLLGRASLRACMCSPRRARARFPTGTLSVYRHSAGFGMRMDGIGYSGMTITPYYDSLLVKYPARGSTFGETLLRMRRALQEARIRGVKTNIPFLLNCLTHPQFESGKVRRRLRWRL